MKVWRKRKKKMIKCEGLTFSTGTWTETWEVLQCSVKSEVICPLRNVMYKRKLWPEGLSKGQKVAVVEGEDKIIPFSSSMGICTCVVQGEIAI